LQHQANTYQTQGPSKHIYTSVIFGYSDKQSPSCLDSLLAI